MYFIIYPILKLLSLLPLPILYLLSDFVYFLMYRVFGYRKKVVLHNLQTAFPEKSEEETEQIMKEFYHNLCDTFIEIIKLISWNKDEIVKRMHGNAEMFNQVYGKDQKIQLLTAHFFNWELANVGMAAVCKLPFLGVYMPLTNKVMNRIFYDFRKKTGTVLIAATDFKNDVSEYLKKQYALILVSDQNPGNPEKAYWLNFFNKPAPFVMGPEKGAKQKNTVVLYADFYKVKRGYYEFKLELITTNPDEFKDGELTKLIVSKIEQSIRQRPANYLWSHRRWKYEWNESYRNLWVDN